MTNQNTKHTQCLVEYRGGEIAEVGTQYLRSIATPHTEADARRIVACWNALLGVSTEDLESGAFKKEIARTLAQRDELLAVRATVPESEIEKLDAWIKRAIKVATHRQVTMDRDNPVTLGPEQALWIAGCLQELRIFRRHAKAVATPKPAEGSPQ